MKRPPPLDAANWDFTSCPPGQVRACLYYEAARESGAVKEYQCSEVFRNSPITSPALGTQYIAFFCPEFPDTPWLHISEDLRKERLREAELADLRWRGQDGIVVPNYTLSRFNEELARGQLDFEMSDLQDGLPNFGIRNMEEGKTTWVAVALDWSKSKNTLKREFQELLDRLPDTFASKPPGKCNHLDLLNALGAKRLRDHCEMHGVPHVLQSAIKMWRGDGSRSCPYNENNIDGMRKAIARFKKFLATLYVLKRQPDDRDLLSIQAI